MRVQQRRLSRPGSLAQSRLQTFLHESPSHSLDGVGVDTQLAGDLVVDVPVSSGEEDQSVLQTPSPATSLAGQRIQLGPFVGCQINKVLLQRDFPAPAKSKSLRQSTTEIKVVLY